MLKAVRIVAGPVLVAAVNPNQDAKSGYGSSLVQAGGVTKRLKKKLSNLLKPVPPTHEELLENMYGPNWREKRARIEEAEEARRLARARIANEPANPEKEVMHTNDHRLVELGRPRDWRERGGPRDWYGTLMAKALPKNPESSYNDRIDKLALNLDRAGYGSSWVQTDGWTKVFN